MVAQFQRVFLDDWALQDCGPWREARYFPAARAARRQGDARGARDPGRATSEMYGSCSSAIGRREAPRLAHLRLLRSRPARPSKTLIDAARRGVDVRLVLPGFSDFWAPVYAGRSHYEELLDAGVRIYEWHEALMHAKTAVIDSAWSSVGSTNLDWRSFVHNYEADLIVQDAAFARELERRFRARSEGGGRRSTRRNAASARRAASSRNGSPRQWEYLL